ncbi:NepR family anti-sigma factor [Aquibium oceanicum]
MGTNSEIGRKLREYYQDLMSDDVPDRFTDLLSKLEHAEASKDKDGDAQ